MGDQNINLKEIDKEEKGLLEGWEDVNLGCGGMQMADESGYSIGESEKIKKAMDIIMHPTEEKISTVCNQLETILKEVS